MDVSLTESERDVIVKQLDPLVKTLIQLDEKRESA